MFNPVNLYRASRWLFLRQIPVLPRVIDRLNIMLFHCYIPCTVAAGENLELGYWGIGVVVHARTRIGRNVFIAQGVTIGGRNQEPEVPRIEDNVFIAAGAKVLGTLWSGRVPSSGPTR